MGLSFGGESSSRELNAARLSRVSRDYPATILVPPGRILLNSLYPDSRHRRRAAKYDGRLWLCEPPAPLTARPRTPSGTGVAVPVASPAGLRGLAWSVENVRG